MSRSTARALRRLRILPAIFAAPLLALSALLFALGAANTTAGRQIITAMTAAAAVLALLIAATWRPRPVVRTRRAVKR